MKNIKYNDIINILKIPSYSHKEDKMIQYIIKWCNINKIHYNKDNNNNLYLCKGKVRKNEFYPCITAHLDTVHSEHIKYINKGEELPIIIVKSNNKTKIFCNNFGIGGDDKCGIIISLMLLLYCKKLKVALFTSEEDGLKGSSNLDINFFKDVGYAISFDSPGNNKAAYASNNTDLFSNDFYFDKIKPICDSYNYKIFKSEPFTDILYIHENFNIQCMIFGSGYYLPHTKNEYIILEDVFNAFNLGVKLINSLKYKKYVHHINNKMINELFYLHKMHIFNEKKKINDLIHNICIDNNINIKLFNDIFKLLKH